MTSACPLISRRHKRLNILVYEIKVDLQSTHMAHYNLSHGGQ